MQSTARRVFDVLRFRLIITRFLLEVLFWAGLVFGSLLTRLICEFALLIFRSYDRLAEISSASRSKD